MSKHKLIEKYYGEYARAGGKYGKDVFNRRARSLGYDEQFLQQSCGGVVTNDNTDSDTNTGTGTNIDDTYAEIFHLSCGSGCPLRLRPTTTNPSNPIVIKNKGQTILDFGSGGGHDTFLASRLVGPTGHVVGIDLSRDMIQSAEAVVSAAGKRGGGGGEVSFVCAALDNDDGREETYGVIQKVLGLYDEALDVAADVVISNGVFNLCDNKRAAFALAHRCLKADGNGWLLLSDVCKISSNESVEISCTVGSDSWVN